MGKWGSNSYLILSFYNFFSLYYSMRLVFLSKVKFITAATCINVTINWKMICRLTSAMSAIYLWFVRKTWCLSSSFSFGNYGALCSSHLSSLLNSEPFLWLIVFHKVVIFGTTNNLTELNWWNKISEKPY